MDILKYLFYEKETEEVAKVVLIYNVEPKNRSMYDGYIEVKSIPEEEVVQGKQALLYCNPKTEEIWYEYIDAPKDVREEFEELKNRTQATEDALLALMMMGGI